MTNTNIEFIEATEENWQEMMALGYKYRMGIGIKKNINKGNNLYKKVFPFLKKEADQGDVGAKYLVASEYVQGNFMRVNFQQAYQYYTSSAEEGHSYAQYYLGVMYNLGDGVDKNINKALHWYKKSAELGNPAALEKLGYIYENGEGVDKCSKTAMNYFSSFTKHQRTELDIDHDPAGIAELYLGSYFEKGEIVKMDLQTAYSWYLQSAKLRNITGQYEVAKCYHNGKGVDTDYNEEIKWLKVAAKHGHANSKKLLKHTKHEHSLYGKIKSFLFKGA